MTSIVLSQREAVPWATTSRLSSSRLKRGEHTLPEDELHVVRLVLHGHEHRARLPSWMLQRHRPPRHGDGPSQNEPVIVLSVPIDGPSQLVGVRAMTSRDVDVFCGELQKTMRYAENLWTQMPPGFRIQDLP